MATSNPNWTLFKRERITRHDGGPYLERWIVVKCPWFGVMLHRFLASDDECEHDHPWPFLSVILRGGYTEWAERSGIRHPRWFRPGAFIWRPAWWAHRIEIDPARPPITLVIVGRRVRTWGFFTAFGWLPWFRYRYAEHCAL